MNFFNGCIDVPVCQRDKMASKMYVSNKADNVMAASCYVDAKPAVDNFWWTYYSVNRTPEAVNIPKAWHSELEGHSQLKIASLNAPWRGHSVGIAGQSFTFEIDY